MTPQELTDRLCEIMYKDSDRSQRHKAAIGLIGLLRARIKDGNTKLGHSKDQDAVWASLPRLRALESLLVGVLALEVELSIPAIWLQSFGGRITGTWPIEQADRWWSGVIHQSSQQRYFQKLQGEVLAS